MSAVHLHLALTHFPVIGAVIALLLLAYTAWRGGVELLRAALGLYVLIGGSMLVVYFTGEPAEEAVEHLPGFSEALVERHETTALIATIAMGIAGALALAALLVQRRRALPQWVARVGLVIGSGLVVLLGYTANLGGQIRHTEIRSGTTAATQPASTRQWEKGDD